MAARRSRGFALVTGVLVAATLVACGGDDDGDAAGSDNGDGGSETTGSTAASSGDGGDPCPLTVEQVSEAVGATVELSEGVCLFQHPEDINPSVTFVRQVPFACGDAVVSDPEFGMEPYDGLSVDAYASAPDLSVGTILVCTDPPFEIQVDLTASSGELDIAAELAELVLENE